MGHNIDKVLADVIIQKAKDVKYRFSSSMSHTSNTYTELVFGLRVSTLAPAKEQLQFVATVNDSSARVTRFEVNLEDVARMVADKETLSKTQRAAYKKIAKEGGTHRIITWPNTHKAIFMADVFTGCARETGQCSCVGCFTEKLVEAFWKNPKARPSHLFVTLGYIRSRTNSSQYFLEDSKGGFLFVRRATNNDVWERVEVGTKVENSFSRNEAVAQKLADELARAAKMSLLPVPMPTVEQPGYEVAGEGPGDGGPQTGAKSTAAEMFERVRGNLVCWGGSLDELYNLYGQKARTRVPGGNILTEGLTIGPPTFDQGPTHPYNTLVGGEAERAMTSQPSLDLPDTVVVTSLTPRDGLSVAFEKAAVESQNKAADLSLKITEHEIDVPDAVRDQIAEWAKSDTHFEEAVGMLDEQTAFFTAMNVRGASLAYSVCELLHTHAMMTAYAGPATLEKEAEIRNILRAYFVMGNYTLLVLAQAAHKEQADMSAVMAGLSMGD